MKRLCLILLLLVAFNFSRAQYTGGSNDGFSLSSVAKQNSLPSIYHGSSNDGFSLSAVANQNPLPSIYLGGSNDGFSLSFIANQNPLPSIYHGGSNDGFSLSSIANQNPLPSIYHGGSNDGFSLSFIANQNPLPSIYHGGSNDGFSLSSIANQNPLPNIYTGGNDDGFTHASVLNQNPPPFSITCPAGIVMECITEAPCPTSATEFLALPGASATGFCTSNLNYSCSTVLTSGNNCTGIFTRTHTITDDCSNSASCTQIITVHDNTNPTATNPAAVNIQCIANIPAANPNVVTDEADNCSTPTVALQSETNNGGTGCTGNPYILTRTYRVTDACDNFIDVVQILTALDNTNPTATNPAAIIVQCIANIPAANPNVVTDESDNCSTPTVTLHSETINGGSGCPGNLYIVTRTYRVMDACGNFIDVVQTITALDNTNPTATNPAAVNVQCIADIPAANPNVVTDEADNCSTPTVVLQGETNNDGTGCSGNPYIVTRTYRVTDACGNFIDVTHTLTALDNSNPVIEECKSSTSRLLDLNETNYTVQGNEFDVTASDNCSLASLSYNLTGDNIGNGTSLSNINLSHGVTTVTWTATDACGNTQTCIFTITINKRPTIIVYTGDNDEQYSDHTNLSAELIDELTNALLATKTISFVIGVQNKSAITNSFGMAATTLHIYQDLGDYDVTASFAGDDVYAASSSTEDYDILKENASVEYTGPEFISVPCTTCPTTTILLSALLKDTTSGMPPGDHYPGDIRKARVKFVDLNNPSVNLSGWLTPGLVNPADTTRGLVNYLWTIPIPNTGYETYSIGVIADCDESGMGNYIGNTQTVINVSRSSLTEFITGGGHVKPTASGGTYASDPGKKTNFGFNVKFNKSMKSLQGKVNIIFRKGTEVYQIKSTSNTSLSINSTDPCSKKAIFISKANLQNVTNPNIAPVTVLGNLHLQLDLVDNGEPGTNNDRTGISLFNGNTLVYSSNTPYNVTLPLNGGNIVVHNGVVCNNRVTVNNKTNYDTEINPPTEDELTVKVFPNPTENNFTLQVMSNSNETVEVTVFDISGKLLKKINGNAGQAFQFGDEWKGGNYVAVIRQGKEQKIIKLIKQ